MGSKNISKAAFTLVELSIVLLIIGLLVGTVTVGRILIKSSQTKALISQLYEVDNATSAFVDQYNAVPGDFGGAQSTWGATSCPSSNPTCPGNNNSQVDSLAGSNVGREPYTFFMHLSLAGLLSGNYNGFTLPKVKLKNTYMTVRHLNPMNRPTAFQNILNVGLISPTTMLANMNAFTSKELYDLDCKIDDCVAYTGKVIGYFDVSYDGSAYVYATSGCPAVNTAYTPPSYRLNTDGIHCIIGYIIPSIN